MIRKEIKKVVKEEIKEGNSEEKTKIRGERRVKQIQCDTA